MACALALLCATPVGAAVSSLSPSGSVHRLSSESLAAGGSEIVHVLQTPDGPTSSRVIPGTEDPLADISPSISAEPAGTGRAAAAWSRWNGSDYDVVVSIWDGTRWGTIKVVSALLNDDDDMDPQIVWGRSGLIHLMWRSDTSTGPLFYQIQMDATGKPVRGPNQIVLSPCETVSDGGGSTDAGAAPKSSDILFAFLRNPAPGGGMSLFGGRDEPMPIGYRIDFASPKDQSSSPGGPEGSYSGDRLSFLFRQNGRLYYTERDPAGWSPYRFITLSQDMSDERAENLIREMLERTAAP